MHVQRNTEARTCNHCSGKAMSITQTVCVCSLRYPACNAMCYIVICGLLRSTELSHIIS
jgi:hypothetical protein